jgi:GNAT superfamily N-acetyltransferase
MCLSVRRPDNVGLIHWLHAGEDFDIIAALLSFAREHLGRRTLHAFTAPTTRAGVPGLPVTHRPATARALVAVGFTPAASQHYLLRDLTETPAEPFDYIANVTSLPDLHAWRLTVVGPENRVVATALLSRPDRDFGAVTLDHLVVLSPHRRLGIGHRLLSQCLDLAADAGASLVATYADAGDEVLARFLAAHDFDRTDTLTVYHRQF